MIVAFSTSSPVASFAVFEEGGALLGHGESDHAHQASGSLLGLLETWLADKGLRLQQASCIVSDVGPGSFTGVRVGVTLAKSMAFALGASCSGVSSFDLIDFDGPAVVPARKGSWFVREPGQDPYLFSGPPAEPWRGYGGGIELPTFPMARRLEDRIHCLEILEPHLLLPSYLAEPNISTPKTPYRTNSGAGERA